MPVIVIKAREGVIKTNEQKKALIEGVAEVFARAAGDESYRERVTVILEEIPGENWGLKGRQYCA